MYISDIFDFSPAYADVSIRLSKNQRIENIVNAIYADVTDRRGIKQAFWECDEETIEDIKAAWYKKIEKELEQ
jgi:(p)ppGpp synthase/HD superfamily hydrolase